MEAGTEKTRAKRTVVWWTGYVEEDGNRVAESGGYSTQEMAQAWADLAVKALSKARSRKKTK